VIRVYADDRLVYAPQLPDYALTGLQVTVSATSSGTATITMPPGHPAMDAFTSYKTLVTIYRNGELLFRGRALYATDDFYNCRAITCEGERGFLQDSVVRPYLYQDSPAAIFAELIANHNAQVDASKTFVVGTVTVTDENDYVRMESQTADQTAFVLDALVERVGGYIVFTTNNAGQRVINWYAAPGYRSEQVIEFGENLLDFSRTGASTDMATAILPYGAVMDDETGNRLTVESVNDGLDFIQDDEAVALRGFIMRPMYWDDVTEPANLLRKARQALAVSKNIVTTLQVSSIDLSVLDKNIDTFQVLDLVRVRSKPHNVDEDFLLTDRNYDLLAPELDTIVLGKDVITLTGADAAGDRDNRNELHKTEAAIREEYKKDIAQVIEETKLTLVSLIQQTETAIRTEVSEQYATNEEVNRLVSTQLTQLADSFEFLFTELENKVDENDAEARAHIEEQKSYIRFEDGVISLGETGNAITLELDNDLIVFKKNGAQFGWWDGVDFHTGNIVVEVNERAQFGNFAAIPRNKGNLSWLKVKN
jgi:phage minor structural protein